VWAVRVDDDHARLENTPFFARGYAAGDVVLIATDDEDVNWVNRAVEYSGNCTIRIIPTEGGHRVEVRQAVLDAFAPLGVDGEGIEQFGLVALNVPPILDSKNRTIPKLVTRIRFLSLAPDSGSD
jgi:hypothetical protein